MSFLIRNQKEINIIGRTSCSVTFTEMAFPKKDYYRVGNTVWKLIIKHKINSLPVDLYKILREENIMLATYKSSAKIFEIIDKNLAENNLGFSLKIKNNYYIFYNDSVPEIIQRFTIAHEIGHIKLKHFYSENHKNDEKEANMFAARLLMPMCILYECNVDSVKEISIMCKVSNSAARFRYKRLQLVKLRNKFYVNKNEFKVKLLFKKFIENYIKNK